MILSAEAARDALDYTTINEMPPKVTSILLPGIDDYLKSATGKDWGKLTSAYTAVDPTAITVASILLVRWFNDPGQIGQVNDVGVLSMITQLEAKALVEKQAEAAE